MPVLTTCTKASPFSSETAIVAVVPAVQSSVVDMDKAFLVKDKAGASYG